MKEFFQKNSFKYMGAGLRPASASTCACGPKARPHLFERIFLEELFQRKNVIFFENISTFILWNLYFVVVLKCIDAKFAATLNQLLPSKCIAHSNQSTQPSFAIYQNVFSRRNNFIVKRLRVSILLLSENYKISFSRMF